MMATMEVNNLAFQQLYLKTALPLVFAVYAVYYLILKYRSAQQAKKPDKICFQRASRFTPDSIPANLDTIVIGSGPGACTCANLLAHQRRHKKVLVLEQHAVTGGGTHSFHERGCEWDTGLHYTSQAMSDKTARAGSIMDYMTHGSQKFRMFPEPYDEILFPDRSAYPYMNGKQRTIDAIMCKLAPHDKVMKQRVETYMAIYSDIHHGFVALGLSRILPRWLQFLVRPKVQELLKLASFSVRDVQYAVLNLGYTKELLLQHACPHAPFEEDHDPVRRRLKAILAHPIGDYGCQPRTASFAAHGVTAEHYIDGGSYTVGPTQNISIRMTSVIRALGGEVLVDATVRQILVENGRAVGVLVSSTSEMELLGKENAPVTEIRAKHIVCGTSAYNLYNSLLPPDLPVVQQFHDPAQRTMRQSNGHLFVFCKLKGDPDELHLPDHNLWYFHVDDQHDLDAAFDNYYANPYKNRPPIVYLGFPCTKDPTWKRRFPGHSNLILICDALYDWFEPWSTKTTPRERGVDYENLKETLTKHLVEILDEFVPQVKGKVEFIHFATPLTEESFLGSYRGGAYDTLCNTDMFAPVNQKWITTPHTSIRGLYLAGSSAFFPGLTGSMYGGCLGACAVLGFFGSIKLGWNIIGNLANRLRQENPKMSRLESYKTALRKFVQG